MKRSFSLLAAVLAMGALTLGFFAWAARRGNLTIEIFTRDPASIAQIPFYYGMLSNLGVLLWAFASAVCVFGFFVLKGNPARRAEAAFLLGSGLLSGFLLFDDFFLFHEFIWPSYFHMAEDTYPGLYAGLLLAYLFGFMATIRKTDFLLLGAALALFGVSISVDALSDLPSFAFLGKNSLAEDGSKFLGIAAWLAYFARTAHQFLKTR